MNKYHHITDCHDLLAVLNAEGKLYHPEDDAADIEYPNGERLFTDSEARTLNFAMDRYFDEGIDVCQLALDILNA
jgi:hypothetical protein